MLYGIVEFLGWFGAVTVLAGYLLFSLGKIPNGPVYQTLNLVGGVSVAVNVAAHHAVPSTIVNGIWAVIAAVVLVRMATTRVRARRSSSTAPGAVEGSADRAVAGTAVAHVEPPTTTAVLPVVGPAVRDHAPEADVVLGPDGTAPAGTEASDAGGRHRSAGTVVVGVAPSLPGGDPRSETVPTGAGARLPADADHTWSGTGTDEATTQAAPLTESVPVITATIALALVAAARGQAERADHADQQQH